ncbi:MFS transporter [Sphingopyxis sp. YF1]|uniref:MFS transporter n=1 Tax=Sphingopyxis sp. YF1 TaxID=2482763 RepID=UPI001F618893|nr:MFS transporter [Sphingopyxis sp. YF1]UNU43007.1 MFS transporter [Sphingopyxis sp. YF1]
MMQSSNLAEWKSGWPVVLVGVAGAATSSIQTVALSLIIPSLSAELGWSRAAISVSFTITTLGALLLSPLVGALLDRVGTRRVAIVGVLLKAAALAAVSLTTSAIWTWYLAWIFVAIAAPFASLVVWTKAVAGRFAKQRGLALAITMTGLPIANILFTFVASTTIAAMGWRAVYPVLAASALCVVLPLAFFFLYDQRDLLRRKAAEAGETVQAALPRVLGHGAEVRDALRNRRLWQILIPGFLVSMSLGGLMVHLPSMVTDAGATPAEAATVFALAFGPFAFAGRVATGVLLDRLHAPFVAGIAFILPALAATIFYFANGDITWLIAAGALAGCALGAELEGIAYLISVYFGQKNYGFLYGIGFGFYSIGFGLGPVVAGYIYDSSGSYDRYFVLIASALLVAVPFIAFLGRYPDWTNAADGTAADT